MNEFNEMMNSPTKLVRKARGPLAALLRTIFIDTGMSSQPFTRMINRWIEDPRNGIPKNGKSASTFRGNTMSQISKPDISWKVFLRGLLIQRPVALRFEVHATWKDNQRTGEFYKTITGIDIDVDDAMDEMGAEIRSEFVKPGDE